MKIYVGLASPNGGFVPLAKIIQWVEKRNYDHCYIRFQEPTGEWMIFQASGFAVNIYNLQIWTSENISVKEYEVEVPQGQDIWLYIKSRLGVPYSLKEDFGILLMKVFKLKKNPYSAGRLAEICSQQAADLLKFLGISIPEDTSTIDPSELDSILESKGFPCNTKVNNGRSS